MPSYSIPGTATKLWIQLYTSPQVLHRSTTSRTAAVLYPLVFKESRSIAPSFQSQAESVKARPRAKVISIKYYNRQRQLFTFSGGGTEPELD